MMVLAKKELPVRELQQKVQALYYSLMHLANCEEYNSASARAGAVRIVTELHTLKLRTK